MKKIVRLTENDIRGMVTEIIANIRESSGAKVVYHCGDFIKERYFVDVIWFSSTPIKYFGEPHSYEVVINNPLVINANGAGWSDKLWWECCKPSGEPSVPADDPNLTSKAPSFIWKLAQESKHEIEYGDIPYIVKKMYDKGEVNYDGVILRSIGETPTENVITDDYVVFNLNQVKLIK